MSNFNDIGISRQLDWPRIRKLLCIGVFASLLHLAGDLLLGWGVEDEAKEGILRLFSAYTGTSDGGIFAAALLGLFGVTLEGLSCFGVYRLMAEKSPAHAHRYRAGIFGYVIFGGCGYHVPVCAMVFLMKHGLADDLVMRYAGYFLLPSLLLFVISFLVLTVTQIQAFRQEKTPYPRKAAVFSMLFGLVVAAVAMCCGNHPLNNALYCAWLAIGNLWMFGGLLATMKQARK